MKKILIALIKFYRAAISPYTRAHCKYIPTCSQYGLEAMLSVWTGGDRALRRAQGKRAHHLEDPALQSLFKGRVRPRT